jgi:preprotein translocase SecE subunit
MGLFEVYKKGQGTTARAVAAASMLGIGIYGAYEVMKWLSESPRLAGSRLNLGIFALPAPLLISGGVFVIFAVITALLVNNPRFVDYLINSEAELRKVSWPTRAELKRQTIVVIITMVAFGILLLIADLLFGFASRQLYGF